MSDQRSKSKEKEDLVITPGGPRAKSLVHGVGPNEVVKGDAAGKPAVVKSRGPVPGMAGRKITVPPDFVVTPGGFRHRSLVHQVQEGHALHYAANKLSLMKLSDKSIIDIPQAAIEPGVVPALGSGWITYAYWNNGSGTSITEFRTTWVVPPAPSTQGNQIIFLFNGIQNYGANFGILQPVAQWGVSAAGGGPYWSVASWYVTSGGQAFHTNLVQVNPGDTLVGVMALTGQSGGLFSYTSAFDGINGTSLPVQNIAELLWCNETLEAYNVNQCSDYPDTDSTQYQAISILTGGVNPNINWTPVDSVTDCGQHTVVVSNSSTNGEVDIFYRTANQWASLGGQVTSVPCARQNADGRLEVFVRGGNGELWHIWQTAPNNGWSGWDSLGGGIIGDPAAIQNADGRLEVFACGTDSALWHIWQTAPSNGWSGWDSLGGGSLADPAVGQNADGRLEVFVVGTDNALWHIWQTAPNNGWSGWDSLGGGITSVSVGRNQDGRLEVFARGSDGALWHIWQTAPSNGWSGWDSLGGGIVGTPFASQNADGRLEIFAQGPDSALWHIWQTAPNNGWSGWDSLGGVITSDPAVSQNADGRLEVFVRGGDGAEWHIWQTAPNNGWSGWDSLGGGIVGDQSVSQNADGRLEVFVQGPDNALWHRWQTAPSNGWN